MFVAQPPPSLPQPDWVTKCKFRACAARSYEALVNGQKPLSSLLVNSELSAPQVLNEESSLRCQFVCVAAHVASKNLALGFEMLSKKRERRMTGKKNLPLNPRSAKNSDSQRPSPA